MKTAYRIAAVALLVSGVAQARPAGEDWRVVGFFGQGEARAFLTVDAASLTSPSADTREITISNAFDQRQPLGSTGAFYTIMNIRYRIDCVANTRAIHNVRMWDGDQFVVESDTIGEAKPTAPGSPIAKVTTAACARDFSGLARVTAATPAEEARRLSGGQ